jgi:hypothetical protein
MISRQPKSKKERKRKKPAKETRDSQPHRAAIVAISNLRKLGTL